MAGRAEPDHLAVAAPHAIGGLQEVLTELAGEQAGLAQSLHTLIDCAEGSLGEIPEPAFLLAEELLAHARASVLIATYLVRMIDGYRRRRPAPDGEMTVERTRPPIGSSA